MGTIKAQRAKTRETPSVNRINSYRCGSKNKTKKLGEKLNTTDDSKTRLDQLSMPEPYKRTLKTKVGVKKDSTECKPDIHVVSSSSSITSLCQEDLAMVDLGPCYHSALTQSLDANLRW